MKKIIITLLIMISTLTIAACDVVNIPPSIDVENDQRTARVGLPFDPLLGVTASDIDEWENEIDLTEDLVHSLTTDQLSDEGIWVGPAGNTSYTVSVTDAGGETTNATISVTVAPADTLAPQLSGLKNINYIIGDPTPNYLDGVTATDNVDGNMTSSIVVDSSAVNLTLVGSYDIIYSVTDQSGNEASQTVQINVDVEVQPDTTKPVLSGIPASITYYVGDPVPNYLSGVTAIDDTDGNLTAAIDVNDDLVDLEEAGTYQITYSVSDDAGNVQTANTNVIVMIRNDFAPVLSGVEDRQSWYIGSTTWDPLRGITAHDVEDGDLTDSITYSGLYRLNQTGTYNLQIKVTDEGGLTTTRPLTLTVKSNPNIPTTIPTTPISITLWHSNGDTVSTALTKYAGQFRTMMQAQGYDITVNIVKNGSNYDEIRTNTINAIQGGTLPDLVQGYPDHMMEYINHNVLVSTNPYFDHPTWGFGDAENGKFTDIIENYRRENNQYTFDGEYFSMPFNKSTEVVIYNKTVFNALGINSFPETWQELFALAPQFNAYAPGYLEAIGAKLGQTQEEITAAKTNFIPFSYDSDENAFITLLRQFGGNYTTINSSRQGVIQFGTSDPNNQPQATRDMLSFVFDNRNIFNIPQHWPGKEYASDLFKIGQTFVTVGSTGGARYNTPDPDPTTPITTDAYFEFETAPVPYNADRPDLRQVIQQGTNISLIKTNNQVKQLVSWLFLKYLTSYEAQLDFALTTGYSPVRESVYTNANYLKYISGINPTTDNPLSGEALMISKALRAASEQREYFYFDQAYVGSSEARNAVGVAFAAVALAPSNTPNKEAFINDIITQAYEQATTTLGS